MNSESTSDVSSLDRTFARGILWTAGAKWSTQLVTWGSVLALARLLSPRELGLAGMAGAYNLLSNIVAEFGIGGAVLQMRELSTSTIRQLNTISVLLGFAVMAITAWISPYIAAYFGAEEVRWLVIANSVELLLSTLQAIPNGTLRKNLDYRRLSIIEAIQVLLRAVISVIAAWFGASYWSTVIGGLSGKIVATGLTIYYAPSGFQWPRLADIAQPLRFGGHLAASTLFNALSEMADVLVIGNRLGERAVGSYRMAIDIGRVPAERLSSLLMRVSVPLFSSVQHDLPLLRRYYLRITELLAVTTFPLSVGLALVSEDAVAIVLGPKWAEAAIPLSIVSMAMALQTLITLNNQVLIATRNTRYLLGISILTVCVLPALMWMAANSGLVAVASAWLAYLAIPFSMTAFSLRRKIHLRLRELLLALAPAGVSVAVMAVALMGMSSAQLLGDQTRVVRLSVEIFVGALCYAGSLFLLFPARIRSYFDYARNLRNNKAPDGAALPGTPSGESDESLRSSQP